MVALNLLTNKGAIMGGPIEREGSVSEMYVGSVIRAKVFFSH